MSDSPPKKLSRHWLFQIGIALIVLPFLGLVIHNYHFFRKAMDAGSDKDASDAAVQAGVAQGWAISSWTCPLMMAGIILTIYATIAHIRRLERRSTVRQRADNSCCVVVGARRLMINGPTPPPMSEQTDARVAALEEYGIMDTPPEQVFDDLTRLTSFICGTPIALVSLLDQSRQWFKSKVGLDADETPIEMAFCSHAIEDRNVFVVPDATEDDRFAENPLVTGDPNIRFYAGAPLRTREGVALGTLCAIDSSPRDFSAEQQISLKALARQVMWALEYRKTSRELIAANEKRLQALKEAEQLRDLLPMCAWCRKVRDDEDFWKSVEDYLVANTDIDITHGLCPDCAEKMDPDNQPGDDSDAEKTK